MPRGKVFVLSGPSGVGKTTLCKEVAKKIGCYYSISTTTRSQRVGEKHGIDYFFVSQKDFKQSIKEGRFIEYARVHGNFYGTYKAPVEEKINQGLHVIMDLDTQGALNLKKSNPNVVIIFVRPPDLEELKSRIINRNTENSESVTKRLAAAQKEMQFEKEYDFVVVNDQLDVAIGKVVEILYSTAKRTLK